MQHKDDKELGHWHNSLQKLKRKAQAYTVLPGVPSGASTLIELFLLNYFKQSADDKTCQDLVNLLTESLPGRILFKNILLAGAAWSCGGVETQSKGQVKRKFLKKYQSTHDYVIDHKILGLFTVKNTLYVSKLKSKKNVATVMHELTHGLCNAIYQNSCLPYRDKDDQQLQLWQEYIANITHDLECYALAMQAKIKAKNATPEEIREYKLYNMIIGFKLNGYAEHEYVYEAIAHLVQAVVYQDIDDYRRLSPETKNLATQLLHRFSQDCATWSAAILQDIGLGLIEDPHLCRNRGSEVERAKAGDFIQSGLLYCSADQAEIVNTAISCHIPIVDMWLNKIFQCIMTDHWREGFDKYDMLKQYTEYYAWLEQQDSELPSKESTEEILEKRLFTLWNTALEQQRLSLNGLFESLVRCIKKEFIYSSLKVFFNLVDIHARGERARLKFDYNRAVIFISKHYSPDYYHLFFEFAVTRFAREDNFFNESVLFWLGASGHPAIVDALARMPYLQRHDFERTLKAVFEGAVRYGKAQLVELLAQRYTAELMQILQPQLLYSLSANLVHYGHVGIVEILCREFPSLRACLVPLYLCIANKRSVSFTQLFKCLDMGDFITPQSTDDLIDLLCKNGFYKELEELIGFIAAIKPECLNLNGLRNGHKIQQFIAQGDLKAFEIMAKFESEIMCKDYRLNSILHIIVLFNRYEFAVSLKNSHPECFDKLVADRNADSESPFDCAMLCGDFKLAALFSLDGLIAAVHQTKVTPATLPRNKSKTASAEVVMIACVLATAGKHYEKTLAFFIDEHRTADLMLQYEMGSTLLHYAAYYDLPLVAKRILDRFPLAAVATNCLSETPLLLAMKKSHDEVALMLCRHQLPQADQNQWQIMLGDAVKSDCLAVLEEIIHRKPELLHMPVCASYLGIPQPTIAMLATMVKSHKILTWVKERCSQAENFRGFNPLMLLMLTDESINFEKTLQEILANGGEAFFEQDPFGRYPMHLAACASLKMCKSFYQFYPNFNVRDAQGNSPLHSAMMAGKTENAKFLVESRRAKQVTNHAGLRPIHLAAAKGSVVIIDLLHAFPEEINVLTQEGDVAKSPLVLAILNGKEKAAMYLVNHGADLHYPGYSTSDLIKLATNHAMHAVAKAIFNKSINFEACLIHSNLI